MDPPPKLGAYSPELQKALYPRRLRLGEIRLLSFASIENSVLHCKLRPLAVTTDEISPIPYDALSYVWGNQESDLQRIFLNNQPILITHNLYAALCAIWSSAARPHIWADALCINQHDNEEKNVQVTRMHHIYSMASCVRVWLGEMTQPVKKMLPYLPQFDRLRDTSYTDNSAYGEWSCKCLSHTGPTSRPKEVCLHRRPNGLEPSDQASNMWAAVLYGLNDLLSRQWFARAWTMQEAILARKAIMHFGSNSMDWDDFRTRCSKTDGSGLQIRNYLVREVFAAQSDIEKRMYLLSQFLVLGWPRESFDPKDKVFSLFGLLPELPFKVDYSRSLRDVYIAATRACIATEKNLRVLSAAGLSGNVGEEKEECGESPDATQPQCKWFGNCSHSKGHCQPGFSQTPSIQREFPSWVTDWRAEGCKKTVSQTDWYMTVANIDKETIGQAIALQKVDDSSGCLLLTGITLGRFSTHKSFKRHPLVHADGSVSARGWLQYAGAFVEFPPCTAKTRDELDHELSNLSPFFHAVHQHDVGKCDCTEDIRQSPLKSIYSVGGMEHHKLCTDGDWLCILDGATVPFILRPDHSPPSTKQCTRPKSTAFTLIGGMRTSFSQFRGQYYGELLNITKQPLTTYLGRGGEARIVSEERARETLERSRKEGNNWYLDAMEGRRPVKGVGGVIHLH